MLRKTSSIPHILCFLCFLCFLCLPTAGLAQAPQELIYGAGLVPRGLNPLLDRNEWNEVSSVLLSRLFRPDHRGQIVGDLVESYAASGDGLTYTLRLRANARWHDGTPFSADDVLFTWQKLFDPATQTSLDLNQPMVRSYEKTGAHEFVFHLKYPDAGFLAPLTEVAILPVHLLRDTDINSDAFDRNPIGTGPYKLVGRSDTSEFTLDRHDAYHLGTPAIPRLILRVIADDAARAEAVAHSEVHLAQVKPQNVERLAARSGIRLYRLRTGAWRGMPLNLRRAAWQEVRARRALDLAINREAIVADALGGYGQPAYSPIPPVSWAFDEKMNARRYDPKKAERLLEAAGWKKSAEGWRERRGEVLTLEIIVWREETFRRTAAELLRAQLASLGIRANLHLVDGATYNRLADDMSTTYDTFIGGWGGLLDPGDNLAKKFATGGSQNYMGYSNPEVDRRLARVRALGPERREEARRPYRRLVKLLTAEAVFLPLAYPDYLFAADVRLAGLDDFVCDSWYEFTKYAHEWRWRGE